MKNIYWIGFLLLLCVGCCRMTLDEMEDEVKLNRQAQYILDVVHSTAAENSCWEEAKQKINREISDPVDRVIIQAVAWHARGEYICNYWTINNKVLRKYIIKDLKDEYSRPVIVIEKEIKK